IGFQGRWDYGAIGTVTNLAARLCGEAKPGQILISRKLHGRVDDLVAAEPVGELALKGFSRPVSAYNLTAPKTEGRAARTARGDPGTRGSCRGAARRPSGRPSRGAGGRIRM